MQSGPGICAIAHAFARRLADPARLRTVFFLKLNPASFRTRQIDTWWTTTPRSPNSAASARIVIPGALTRSSNQSRWGRIWLVPRLPPWGFAAAVPVALSRCDHFTTLATLTPNRSATSRHGRVAAAAATRSRRSSEYDRGIPYWPPDPANMMNHNSLTLGIPFRFKQAATDSRSPAGFSACRPAA